MPGAGPVKVVTDKAVLEADAGLGRAGAGRALPGRRGRRGAGRRRLAAPVAGATSREVAPPTDVELRLLRDVLDPHRLYLKG